MKKIFYAFLIAAYAQICGAQTEAYTVMVKDSGELVAPDKVVFATQNKLVNTTNAATIAGKLYRDFYIYVDMSPSPAYRNTSDGKNTIHNDFYYKDADGTLKQTVSKSGAEKKYYTDYDKYQTLQWWTDFEVKVIDKWGNTLYFSSTIALQNQTVINGHSEIIDKTPKVYYLPQGYDDNQCFRTKTAFTDFTKSIGSKIGSGNYVSGVWLYPSISSTEKRSVKFYTAREVGTYKNVVWGDYIREIFANPDNLIIVWRQTTQLGEHLSSWNGGSKYWRVVQPTYYGDFKIKQ